MEDTLIKIGIVFTAFGIFISPVFTLGIVLGYYGHTLLSFLAITYSLFLWASKNKKNN